MIQALFARIAGPPEQAHEAANGLRHIAALSMTKLADGLLDPKLVLAWLFTALALAASAFIVWLLRSHAGQKLFAFSLAMILGGAIGNVIDRSLHGYVVDFLDFHWSFLSPLFYRGHFPAFNLADSAITLGAVCLVLDELRRVRRGR